MKRKSRDRDKYFLILLYYIGFVLKIYGKYYPPSPGVIRYWAYSLHSVSLDFF